MKTTLTFCMVKKCLKNLWQPLPIILFIMFLSTISISNGGYLLASTSNLPISIDKNEYNKDKYHHAFKYRTG